MLRTVLALFALTTAHALVVSPLRAPVQAASRASPVMQFGWGKPKAAPAAGAPMDARDRDLARRQDRLKGRQAGAASQAKGQVECSFPQKGNKKVMAKQGEPLGKVIQRAGLRVKFDCKNGRCATCQVRLNGRAAAKICQGATVPGGATKRLSITLDN